MSVVVSMLHGGETKVGEDELDTVRALIRARCSLPPMRAMVTDVDESCERHRLVGLGQPVAAIRK